MPTIRQLRRRIRSLQNTARVTNALALIAGSKVRLAQQRGVQGRPYSEHLRGILGNLMATEGGSEAPHPLLQQRAARRVGYIHITADRGLCGPLNANMNRAGARFIAAQPGEVAVIAMGRRGREFLARTGARLIAVFDGLGDAPTLADVRPIARIVMDDFRDGRFDQVSIGFSGFVNTLMQRPRIERLLPVEVAAAARHRRGGDYLYEPDPTTVLGALLPHYVEMQVYHAVLEHLASEHSARMVAMRSASDNAREMVKDLQLALNNVRHETITRELLDRWDEPAFQHRVPGLPAKGYRELASERWQGGMIHARLTTAVPLTLAGQTAVRELLARRLGKQVYLTVDIDPGLVAGAELRVAGKLWDGSARTDIAELRRRLRGA